MKAAMVNTPIPLKIAVIQRKVRIGSSITPYFIIGQPDPKARVIRTSSNIAFVGMPELFELLVTRASQQTARRTIEMENYTATALRRCSGLSADDTRQSEHDVEMSDMGILVWCAGRRTEL